VMAAPRDRIRRDPTLEWLRMRTTLGPDFYFCSLEIELCWYPQHNRNILTSSSDAPSRNRKAKANLITQSGKQVRPLHPSTPDPVPDAGPRNFPRLPKSLLTCIIYRGVNSNTATVITGPGELNSCPREGRDWLKRRLVRL
jgi:hypothetical protein